MISGGIVFLGLVAERFFDFRLRRRQWIGPAATPWALIGVLCAIAAFYATARSLQVGDGVGVIAATASTANLLGILGGIVIFGDPLGNGPVTVTGRLVAFSLAVIAVGLVPAPMRAREAVRQEEKKLEPDEDQRPSRAEWARDEHEAESVALAAAQVAG